MRATPSLRLGGTRTRHFKITKSSYWASGGMKETGAGRRQPARKVRVDCAAAVSAGAFRRCCFRRAKSLQFHQGQNLTPETSNSIVCVWSCSSREHVSPDHDASRDAEPRQLSLSGNEHTGLSTRRPLKRNHNPKHEETTCPRFQPFILAKICRTGRKKLHATAAYIAPLRTSFSIALHHSRQKHHG